MATASVGLTTYRWNNNLKSLVLLATYPFIIAGAAWLMAFIFGLNQALMYENRDGFPVTSWSADWATEFLYQWWPSVLALVGVWFAIAYLMQTRMIRKLAHSHSISRTQEPALYNLLENLCISRGIPMPKLEIIETHARNAFASGIDRRTYTITVSRGLLNNLTHDEVEAVLAHELTHIMRGDVRLLIITIIFMGMFGLAAQIVWDIFRHSSHGRGKKGNSILIVLAMLVVLYLGYFATIWTRFAISRRREFDADAGAVQLTKKPEAMMSALMRINRREELPEYNGDIAMMCIVNARPFFGLFDTHPPIGDRIRAISRMTGTPIPDLRPQVTPPKEEKFDPNDMPRRWNIAKNRNPWSPPQNPFAANAAADVPANPGAAPHGQPNPNDR